MIFLHNPLKGAMMIKVITEEMLDLLHMFKLVTRKRICSKEKNPHFKKHTIGSRRLT